MQRRRPEVSAALAAVRRARDRQGARRTATPTIAELVHDLEEVLAIEARPLGRRHRRGDHGPALAVRRHRRLRAAAPARSRAGPAFAAASRSLAVCAAAVALLGNAHREGGRARPPSRTAPQPVRGHAVRRRRPRLRPRRATATSRSSQVPLALDGDPDHGLGDRALRQRRLRQQQERASACTWTPGARSSARGMRARHARRPAGRPRVYVARDSVPPTTSPAGRWWQRHDGPPSAARPSALDTAGKRFRYYLLWITELPEGGTARSSAAGSAEVRLLG